MAKPTPTPSTRRPMTSWAMWNADATSTVPARRGNRTQQGRMGGKASEPYRIAAGVALQAKQPLPPHCHRPDCHSCTAPMHGADVPADACRTPCARASSPPSTVLPNNTAIRPRATAQGPSRLHMDYSPKAVHHMTGRPQGSPTMKAAPPQIMTKRRPSFFDSTMATRAEKAPDRKRELVNSCRIWSLYCTQE